MCFRLDGKANAGRSSSFFNSLLQRGHSAIGNSTGLKSNLVYSMQLASVESCGERLLIVVIVDCRKAVLEDGAGEKIVDTLDTANAAP